MLMKLNEGEKRIFLIYIRLGSCKVRRLTRASAEHLGVFRRVKCDAHSYEFVVSVIKFTEISLPAT